MVPKPIVEGPDPAEITNPKMKAFRKKTTKSFIIAVCALTGSALLSLGAFAAFLMNWVTNTTESRYNAMGAEVVDLRKDVRGIYDYLLTGRPQPRLQEPVVPAKAPP